MDPSISVIIPCYNAERWIGETLESVRAQGLESIEVIVVDDESRDGSVALVERDFPFARVIRTRNGGPSWARNVGTEAARGEYLQYLDSDDLLIPGKLQRQWEALETSGADVAYGDWQRLVPAADGGFVRGDIFSRMLSEVPEEDLFSTFWAPPAAYLFRKSIVERIGGWNMRLPIIQDARFALDCALHGGRFVYTPGVVALYRSHTTGSVSTRSPVAFTRDVYVNALEVERWWEAHGGITPARRALLITLYDTLARYSFVRDRELFEIACDTLTRLDPNYVPHATALFVALYRLVGYRRAAALWAVMERGKDVGRPLKRALQRLHQKQ